MCKVREPQEGKALQIKRALIDGRAYDTEAAEESRRVPKQVNLGPLFCGDGQVWTCREFILYRTARGEFFEFDGEVETIALLTRREARAIMREMDPDSRGPLCWGA